MPIVALNKIILSWIVLWKLLTLCAHDQDEDIQELKVFQEYDIYEGECSPRTSLLYSFSDTFWLLSQYAFMESFPGFYYGLRLGYDS